MTTSLSEEELRSKKAEDELRKTDPEYDRIVTEVEERVRGVEERRAAAKTPVVQKDLARAVTSTAEDIFERCGDSSDFCIEEIREGGSNHGYIRFGHYNDLRLDKWGWSLGSSDQAFTAGFKKLGHTHTFFRRLYLMGPDV